MKTHYKRKTIIRLEDHIEGWTPTHFFCLWMFDRAPDEIKFNLKNLIFIEVGRARSRQLYEARLGTQQSILHFHHNLQPIMK